MKKRAVHVCVVCVCLLGAPKTSTVAEEVPKGSVATLESLVMEWVKIQDAMSSEEAQWEEEQVLLTAELSLLTKERNRLTAIETDAAKKKAAEASAQALLRRRQAELNRQREYVSRIAGLVETGLSSWSGRVPGSLRASMGDAFMRLPRSSAEAQRIPLSTRVQLAFALFTQVEQLSRDIHVVREVVPVGADQRLEMDVLYIGLARGFAVALDNHLAVTGQSTEEGWTWTRADELAGDIREAIKIAGREEVSRMVTLPLRVKVETP